MGTTRRMKQSPCMDNLQAWFEVRLKHEIIFYHDALVLGEQDHLGDHPGHRGGHTGDVRGDHHLHPPESQQAQENQVSF